jgi:hypothetical protein
VGIEFHHAIGVGIIKNVFALRKYRSNGIFIYIHDFRPWAAHETASGRFHLRVYWDKVRMSFPNLE